MLMVGTGVADGDGDATTGELDGDGPPSVGLAELATSVPDGDSPRRAPSGPFHASAEHPPVASTSTPDDATATTRTTARSTR